MWIRVVALSLIPCASFAADMTLTHQSRLLDSTGVPLQGSHSLVIRVMDAETSGNEVYSEVFSVQLDDGYFSVVLGAATGTLDSSMLTDQGGGWIEYVVDSTALVPRQRTDAVPYARQEEILERLDRLTEVLIPTSCGTGQVLINSGDEATYCIDQARRGGVQYEDAMYACASEGQHVCTSKEWYVAAREQAVNSLGMTNICNGSWAWEWTSTRDQANGGGYLMVQRGGNSANCQTKTWSWSGQHNNHAGNFGYRCCRGLLSTLGH